MLKHIYTFFTGRYAPDPSEREMLEFLGGMALALLIVGLLAYLKTKYGIDLAHWIEANYPYKIH